MSSIQQQIQQHIVDKLGIDEELVTEEASFADDLGADSLDVFELIAEIEKDFGIKIPDEDVEKLRTPGALTKYVSRQLRPATAI